MPSQKAQSTINMPSPGKSFSITMERIHWKTDITLVHNILSPEECDHLIKLAEPNLARSGTFTSATDYRRTSSSYFLSSHQNDPVVKELIYRCSVVSNYPMSHVEIPQIVRYFPGEQFMNHIDNFPKDGDQYKWNGQRDYTFFIYLNEPDPEDPTQTGGETSFDAQKFKIKPKQGTAALWTNVDIVTGDDLEYDKICHSGLATANWTKYGMNVWIRHKPWGNYEY